MSVVPRIARPQLIDQYYPAGIPGYESWISDAVLDRPHNEYESAGIRAGDVVIRPSLSEGFGENNNVFGSTHPTGSALLVTQGNVSASSDWSRDSLDATVNVSDQRYLQQPALSHTDWNAGLGGVIDIGQDSATLAYTHVTNTTAAGDIGTRSVGQPTTFALDSAHAAYQVSLGKYSLQPAIDAAVYRFSNTGIPSSSPVATNNRNSFAGSLTGGYSLAPGRSIVAVLTGTDAEYTAKAPGTIVPDYTDLSLVGGLDFRTGSLFRYRALVGFERRSFASAQLASASSPLVELDVIWTPTRLTTVTTEASRSFQEAVASIQSESFTYNSLRLTVDHEYLRNVILEASGAYQIANFQLGSETERVISMGANVTWLLNRRLSIVGSVVHTQSADDRNASLDQTDTFADLSLNCHL